MTVSSPRSVAIQKGPSQAEARLSRDGSVSHYCRPFCSSLWTNGRPWPHNKRSPAFVIAVRIVGEMRRSRLGRTADSETGAIATASLIACRVASPHAVLMSDATPVIRTADGAAMTDRFVVAMFAIRLLFSAKSCKFALKRGEPKGRGSYTCSRLSVSESRASVLLCTIVCVTVR